MSREDVGTRLLCGARAKQPGGTLRRLALTPRNDERDDNQRDPDAQKRF